MCCASPWGSWRKKYTQLSVVYSSVVLESVSGVLTLIVSGHLLECRFCGGGIKNSRSSLTSVKSKPRLVCMKLCLNRQNRSEQRTQIKPNQAKWDSKRDLLWGSEPTLTFPLVIMPSRVREPLSVEESHYILKESYWCLRHSSHWFSGLEMKVTLNFKWWVLVKGN